MRALVVDDEGPARRRLARMLEALPGVRVVAELEDAAALHDALQRHSADVIFLDICMPGVDGMSFAQSHTGLPPVVFVTAHDRSADADALYKDRTSAPCHQLHARQRHFYDEPGGRR